VFTGRAHAEGFVKTVRFGVLTKFPYAYPVGKLNNTSFWRKVLTPRLRRGNNNLRQRRGGLFSSVKVNQLPFSCEMDCAPAKDLYMFFADAVARDELT
jgi:hypothetical protein